jgi:hypothetical protein
LDIAGAKALKKRLGANKSDAASRDPVGVEVAEDAPPVYHWVGVAQAPGTPPPATEDTPASQGISLFRRLGLSSR